MNHGTNHRPLLRRLVGVGLSVAFCTVAASAILGQSSVSVWDGVYSEAQATRGEAVYAAHCMECHGPDFAGREQAPALAGLGFKDKWNRSTVRKLLETVEQMPPDNPKTLTPQQYVDVLGYMLSVNEFPAGAVALTTDRPALARIEIRNVRPEK